MQQNLVKFKFLYESNHEQFEQQKQDSIILKKGIKDVNSLLL